MLVTELVGRVNFHDSCLSKITLLDQVVALNIDLCMWKQNDYQEGDIELKEVNVVFKGIKNYSWDSEKSEEEVDYDTIINFNLEGNKIEVILLDEEVIGRSYVSVMSFECMEVQLYY